MAFAAQLAVPVPVPLYDGVIVEEPYRYVSPAAGEEGDPSSFSAEPGVENGGSRAFVAATSENPPQAQLIALPKAFVLPPGATTVKVSIEARAATPPPAAGSIAGNVYHVGVTDGSGAPLAIATDAQPTLTLRAPPGTTNGTIARLSNGVWVPLQTEHGGTSALFSTNPSELGDFAVVVTGSVAGSENAGVLAAIILSVVGPVGLGLILLVRRSRARRRQQEQQASQARARVASKRRPPRSGGGRSSRRP
jgi:hypothetical protein